MTYNTYTVMEERSGSEQNIVYTIEAVNAATAIGEVSQQVDVPKHKLRFVQTEDLR